MRKNNWLLSALIGLIIVNGFINSAFLWSLCLVAGLLYTEMRFHEVKEIIDGKDKAMGVRLIEGMKALTDLAANAFDHIKNNNLKIDKANAKLGEHSVRLHRLDQQKHRMVGVGDKKTGSQVLPQNDERTFRQKQADKSSLGRDDRRTERTPKNVPTPKPEPRQGDSQ